MEEGEQFSTRTVIATARFGNSNLFFTDQDGIYEMSNTGRLVKRNLFDGMSLLSAIKINDDLISLGTSSNGIIVGQRKVALYCSIILT